MSTVTGREVVLGVNNPPARAPLAVLALTNLVMVAVMAMAPVHLIAHGHSLQHVGLIVSLHVAGMFAPSPLSGWAADRIGAGRIAGVGVLLLVGACVAGAVIDSSDAPAMTAVLVALGTGWNFGLVGGSFLLVASVPAALKPQVEGVGEVAMGVAAGFRCAAGRSAGRARWFPGALAGWCRGGAGVRRDLPKRFCAWSTG